MSTKRQRSMYRQIIETTHIIKSFKCFLSIATYSYLLINPNLTYASQCKYSDTLTIDAFDGRVVTINSSEYTDSNGIPHNIYPKAYELHLYFTRKNAELLFEYGNNHRTCFASFIIDQIVVSNISMESLFLLNSADKYVDQFFVVVTNSKMSSEEALRILEQKPIQIKIEIDKEM